MTLSEAIQASGALKLIDSSKIKINGVKEGQIFYKAFLPLVKWRDRKERLAQPPEVHFKEDGKFIITEITEDWSDENATDPKLIVKDYSFDNLEDAVKLAAKLSDKTSTIFFYAQGDIKLESLFAFRKKLQVQN